MRHDARLSVTLLALMALAAACTESAVAPGQPAPGPVRIAVEPAFAERALPQAEELLSVRGLPMALTEALGEADLAVSTLAPASGGAPFVVRYWVPVVALPGRTWLLDMPALADAVAGRSTLRVLAPLEPPPPITSWFGEPATAVEALPIDEIAAALAADHGAVALLPLEAAGVSVRSVPVDVSDVEVERIDLVFGEGDAEAYPLVERAWVSRRDVADGERAAALDGVATELAARLTAPAPDPIVLRATGDIIPARCVYAKQRAYGDFRHAFLQLGPWLAGADITVGSLDASISDAGAPFDCVETFSLLAPAASVEGLAYAGFDVITVATNHVKDCGQDVCGEQAFFDTLANLRDNGIAPVGGGADLAEARRPAFLRAGGVRFAFLGYDEIAPYYHAAPSRPGTAPLIERYVREDVAAAKAQADVVVVLPQWGVEYTADPTFNQRSLAAAAVEAGADLVIGNHPHWVQAAEVIGTAFVAYALGNFVFDQDWSIETQQGAVLEAAFDGAQLKGVRYHPVRIMDAHQPVFAGPEEAQQIMERIWEASARLVSP